VAATGEGAAMSAAETARAIAAREISAVEAVEAALARIELLDPALTAFITVAAKTAREAAAAADAQVAGGAELGPLHGVPFGAKDLEWSAGVRTTYGSPRFADFVPDADSIAIERLRAAGAILVGKTNTPEFGLLGETRNDLVGETRNPWDRERTVGGSSGGSTAAVAAGMVPVAIGSDTAGSIPCPAAMCGVFGLKPTRGLVPTWPDPGDARILLDSGPIARSVGDARLLLGAMAGPDPRDPTSFLPPSREVPSRPLRIAWNPDWGHLAVDPGVRLATAAAAAAFEELGHGVEEAWPEICCDPFEILGPLIAADTRVLFAAQGIDESDLSEDARAEVERLGTPSLTEYVAALNELTVYRRRVDAFFEDFDLMLTPATAVAAFPLDRPPATVDDRSVPARWTTFMPFQAPCNLAGLPTASVPCGRNREGLPIGLQVSGPRRCEALLLDVCERFEEARPWEFPAAAAA
jgi:Asp-tRNA(Asn)/Glu-tRNA(Gln) amidotransferase A subunit family amidase